MSIRIAVLFIAVLPAALSAQNWTADEQSLIDAIEHCWDQIENPAPERVLSECRPAEKAVYWWTPETAPNYFVSDWYRGLWTAWNQKLISQDLRPIRVQVDGDFGLIFFHGIRVFQTVSGTRETESWRGYEVWKRTQAGWSFFGGMGTPDELNEVR